MDIRQRNDLKQQAGEALSCATYDPRKLFFLHTAAALGLSLVLAVLDHLLTGAMAPTGGLAGMQTRALLSTAQSILQIVNSLALPFWQFGLVFASLQLLRRQPAQPGTLLEGFRRFGPVLRLLLTKAVLLIAVFLLCSYVSAILFVVTPLSQPFADALVPLMENGSEAAMEALMNDAALLDSLLPSMWPLFGIMLAVVAVICIPLAYRLRMTDLIVMDRSPAGSFATIRKSFRLTKGNCLALFRLDLSFWWFYALDLLTLLIYSLDWLLPSLGIALPVSADVAFWVCYILYLLLQLALYTLAAPKVQTTYAAAYEALQHEQ